MKRFSLLFLILLGLLPHISRAQNTLTWSTPAAANWSNPANWGGVGIPDATNDVLVFSAPGNADTNDLVGLSVRSITFSGPSSGYALGGNAITLGEAAGPSTTLVNTAISFPQSISFDIALGRSQTWFPGPGQSGVSNTFNGAINNNGFALSNGSNGRVLMNGVMTGSGTFTMDSGAYFTHFGATNTFTGVTTVNSGSLEVTGSLLGNVNVIGGGAFGSNLQGTGTIFGNTTLTAGATFATGASADYESGEANMNFAGDLSLTNSFYEWTLNTLTDQSSGIAGTDWGHINLTGANNLVFASSSMDLYFFPVNDPDSGDTFWNSSHQWQIANLNSGTLDRSGLGIATSSNSWATGNFGLLTLNGNDLYLYWNPAPEPASVVSLLGGLGLIGVVLKRKRSA